MKGLDLDLTCVSLTCIFWSGSPSSSAIFCLISISGYWFWAKANSSLCSCSRVKAVLTRFFFAGSAPFFLFSISSSLSSLFLFDLLVVSLTGAYTAGILDGVFWEPSWLGLAVDCLLLLLGEVTEVLLVLPLSRASREKLVLMVRVTKFCSKELEKNLDSGEEIANLEICK